MLWTVALALVFIWALGVLTAVTLNGFIHLFLVLSIITVSVRLIKGRPQHHQHLSH